MTDSMNAERSGDDAEALFAAWVVRVEAGEAVDFESLLSSNVSIASELRRLHEDWQVFAPILGSVVPGLISSASGIVMPSLSGGPDADEMPASDELLARLGLHTPNENRYRFRGVLGRGGGGVVLKVWDTKLNRPLAMKIVLGRGEDTPSGQTPRIDGRTLSRFADEARIASQLNHPGIVPVHELGSDDSGRAYFTMKLVRGEDLSRVFEHVRNGTNGWSQPRALDVLLRVCEAMAYAHERGVIHRDLKPANVMVGSYGEVHVMDWGLARAIGAPESRPRADSKRPASVVDSIRHSDREGTPDSPLLTVAGSVVGTPSYMSPEQAKGELETLGPASDVYSLGAMLYELLCGEAPYVPRGAKVDARTIVLAAMHGPPKRIEELAPRAPAELVAICEQAMARDVSARYATMQSLAADLRAFAQGRVVSSFEGGTWAETRKWVLRNKALASALAAVVLVLITGLAVSWRFKVRADERTRAAEWNGYVAALTGAGAARSLGELATARRLLDSAPKNLRNWEWRYLDAASDSSLLVFEGRTAADLSRDGSRVVTASEDNVARVYDFNTGTLIASLHGHTGRIGSIHFDLTGARVVSASDDGTVCVWDANTGSQLAKLIGHSAAVRRASFNPDGTFVLSSSDDQTTCLWDVNSKAKIWSIREDEQDIPSASFSADGSRIFIRTNADRFDRLPRTWRSLDVHSKAQADTPIGPVDGDLWVNNDGSKAVVSTVDEGDGRMFSKPIGTTRLLDVASGRETELFRGEHLNCTWAVFSPDGSRICMGWNGFKPLVVDAETGTRIASLDGGADSIIGVSFSRDGSRIVTMTYGKTPSIWKTESGERLAVLEGHTDMVWCAMFSPDGSRILTVSTDETARVWDSAPARERSSDDDCDCLEGQVILATNVGSSRIVTQTGNRIVVREAVSHVPVAPSIMMPGDDVAVVLSPNASQMVITCGHDQPCLWATSTSSLVARLEGPGTTHCVAFSPPNGACLVTTSENNTTRLWDAESGELRHVLPGGEGLFGARLEARFSSDGTRVVTSNDTVARVWSVASGALIATLKGPRDGVLGASFSPDGTRVIGVTGNGARIWDATSGDELVTIAVPPNGVSTAVYAPDGERIVTDAADAVRIWDPITGVQLARLESDCRGTSPLMWNSDGTRMFRKVGTFNQDWLGWDTVPYRARFAERQRLNATLPAARDILDALLARTPSFARAADDVRADSSLDAVVREAALQEISSRCRAARAKIGKIRRSRADCLWLRRLLRLEPWPDEQAAQARVNAHYPPSEFRKLYRDAEYALNVVGARWSGNEMQALALTRRAMELAPPAALPRVRGLLARALFRVGRFDEALFEYRTAIDGLDETDKQELERAFGPVRTEIDALHDSSGELRTAVVEAQIAAAEAEIAAFELDPDVILLKSESFE